MAQVLDFFLNQSPIFIVSVLALAVVGLALYLGIILAKKSG